MLRSAAIGGHCERITARHHADLGEHRDRMVDERGGNGDAAATASATQRDEAEDCDEAAHDEKAPVMDAIQKGASNGALVARD